MDKSRYDLSAQNVYEVGVDYARTNDESRTAVFSETITTAETSRMAAESVRNKDTQRARILRLIEQYSPGGITDDGLQELTYFDGNTERPRRGELVKMGLIEPADKLGTTRTGRKAVAWRVK